MPRFSPWRTSSRRGSSTCATAWAATTTAWDASCARLTPSRSTARSRDFDLVEALVQGPGNRDVHGKHTGKAAHPAWVVARTVVRRVHALLQEEEVSPEFVEQLFQSENVEHTAKILRAFGKQE